MIPYLCNRWKRDFDDFAVGAFDFHAGCRECLSGFHAKDSATHAPSISSYNLDISFSVKRLERR